MKQIIKYFIMIVLLSTLLESAPARGGLHTFTQPDGTTFQGLLKGDASFHWIESNGKVVMYDPKSKFYFNAKVNAKNQLELSDEKPSTVLKKLSSSQKAPSLSQALQEHEVKTEAMQNILRTLQKQSKIGHHPR